jgi:hypothetical protein
MLALHPHRNDFGAKLCIPLGTTLELLHLLLPFSQLAIASPSAFLTQQQLLPFYLHVVANAATLLQLQQLLSFIQLAMINSSASYQQHIISGAIF